MCVAVGASARVVSQSNFNSLYFVNMCDLILQGVSMACYAEPCISYDRVVRPYVCPFVTRWYSVKTTQARITKSLPTDSPRTLVLS